MNTRVDRDSAEHAPGVTREVVFRADRTVASAMALGVLSFWGVSLAMRRGLSEAFFGLPPSTATNVVLALMLAAVIAAFMLRGRAIEAAEAARREHATELAGLAALRSRLIVAWAILEAPALLAGVVHFTTGAEQVLVWTGPVYMVGFALTFPRPEWYGVPGH